jgi:hypothetical protein
MTLRCQLKDAELNQLLSNAGEFASLLIRIYILQLVDHFFARSEMGLFHFKPGNRAKSASVVCKISPRSMASAAK